jgi:hypothetical protein
MTMPPAPDLTAGEDHRVEAGEVDSVDTWPRGTTGHRLAENDNDDSHHDSKITARIPKGMAANASQWQR